MNYRQLASYQSESESDQAPYPSAFSKSSHLAWVFEHPVKNDPATTTETATIEIFIRVTLI